MTPQIELSKHILSHEALGRKIQKGLDVQKSGGGSSGYLTAKEPDLNKIDIIVAQDQNGLNAGSFFIRRSEWSRMFIDMWAEPTYVEKNWLAQEQSAMVSFPLVPLAKRVEAVAGGERQRACEPAVNPCASVNEPVETGVG